MKTIKKLQSEIDDKLSDINNYNKSNDPKIKKKLKPAKLRLAYLKMCMMYVESQPTVEFIMKERDRLSDRVTAFLNVYEEPKNVTGTLGAKHRKDYEREMGIPKIRKQLTALKYLLN